jgi:hypothetical protein
MAALSGCRRYSQLLSSPADTVFCVFDYDSGGREFGAK